MTQDFNEEQDRKYNELIEELIILRINMALSNMEIADEPNEFLTKALNDIMNDDEIKERFAELGIDPKNFINFDLAVYRLHDDDLKDDVLERLNNAPDEEKLDIIHNVMGENERYQVMKSSENGINVEINDLKKPITVDDVEPISEEDFKKAFGG